MINFALFPNLDFSSFVTFSENDDRKNKEIRFISLMKDSSNNDFQSQATKQIKFKIFWNNHLLLLIILAKYFRTCGLYKYQIITELYITPTIETYWPFTTFSKYPAAPNPDSISNSDHAHFSPLYNPVAARSEVKPNIIKNAGPIK